MSMEWRPADLVAVVGLTLWCCAMSTWSTHSPGLLLWQQSLFVNRSQLVSGWLRLSVCESLSVCVGSISSKTVGSGWIVDCTLLLVMVQFNEIVSLVMHKFTTNHELTWWKCRACLCYSSELADEPAMMMMMKLPISVGAEKLENSFSLPHQNRELKLI